ncbi:threonine--tRNA ligase [Candidatus Roizmanbacteria bacterium RIFCSPLOWO2_12_FULL_40_12]|uniref:Threonine--tRNA ligase n=1 Tax=Candidatus Roizmanbacteria bacterium RIFCSPLOWO2_01_FULL_40_42 TaxID=1802066 RepID=A0A1F7J5P0_9BACT|nr:MAG: threonine--tRNA ligase [Candidatus Roizmanbacteria bacterium RIFCSPHIGHO2_01_FULL_40_98]OGK28363.1 MAG: threonine--tRNA ligase [Candidatus Roizmanbacteria bacterium RIFCSPHIGHO2_02_FULL_40_53]OGK30599.1 MAG: threonine--tRNA ligase [Candidatus Roizmanbacteria bacterium RIFCSPHIGHO2_12_41_18]OGK37013.1 MAG: threonine--tRNA ligase [Candidatus Roizmanbacteria bacterium RIFCSPHIGHO2_12_FULL_40_130]OGK50919.1 MAG: threonine--tRNA ligase [Candidatus Roizmanbacteria bacterium RIFCSPLOWO2_01_FUL
MSKLKDQPAKRDKNHAQRDHREIGRELDLFSFHDVAPGAVFWHHKGLIIYKTLVGTIQTLLARNGYQEVLTPVMVKNSLFKRSGHWDYYHENMFNLLVDDEEYSLKPMNCPEASLIYSSGIRSYQDLPLRLSEIGTLHRNELSGVLGGLFRVRQFTIDDAHHFIRPDQIQEEIKELTLLVINFYRQFGFKTEFYLSTKPDKAMGDPKLWIKAEEDLKTALEKLKIKYDIKEKDGAFYGPKIDIHIRDSQGRDWQLTTIQLDFQIPDKMKLEYIDEKGKPQRPVIIHRAILGSVERFIGIITEHYQGAFPLWLSPIQVEVLSVSDKHNTSAKKVHDELLKEGIRSELNDDNKQLGAKIRESTLQKVPYMVIIGDKETAVKPLSVSIRTREGKDLGLQKLSEFVQLIKSNIETYQ